MKNILKTLGIVTVISLALAGCSKNIKTAALPSIATPVPTPTSAPTAKPLTITLKSVKGSKQTGTAIFTDIGGGKTEVAITLTNEPSSASQPAHIHTGNCLKPGNVLYPLSNVVNGRSLTVINASVAKIQTNGQTSLNVHQSEQQLASYVACSDLPTQITK